MTTEPTQGDLTIMNPLGLHARAASKLVATANRYGADVWVGRDGHEVNGKSILGVLMLACAKGSKIHLRCEGSDASAAYRELARLVGDGFGEI